MYQAVLMNTDIHKDAKVDDIPHCAGENHARFQILHFQYILAKNWLWQFVSGVPAGFAELLGNVLEGRGTYPHFLGSLLNAVALQGIR